jgi:hypothetical protein
MMRILKPFPKVRESQVKFHLLNNKLIVCHTEPFDELRAGLSKCDFLFYTPLFSLGRIGKFGKENNFCYGATAAALEEKI